MRRNKKLTPNLSVGSFPVVIGLAACMVLSSLQSSALAQPAIRVPGAAPDAVAPSQRNADITSVLITYLPNSCRTRIADMGSSSARRGTWMRMLIQFTTRPQWTEELRFDCYVLMRSGNNRTLLTGSVTCTYVQAGRGHLTALFIPPSVLERYGRPEQVAVECTSQNTVVADYAIPRSSRRWWQDYTGVPDTMVTWFYTPFLRDGVENHEQVKPERRGF